MLIKIIIIYFLNDYELFHYRSKIFTILILLINVKYLPAKLRSYSWNLKYIKKTADPCSQQHYCFFVVKLITQDYYLNFYVIISVHYGTRILFSINDKENSDSKSKTGLSFQLSNRAIID